MPNNRQWASLIWIIVLVAWALSRRDIRASLRDIARAAASPKIVVPLAGPRAFVASVTRRCLSAIGAAVITRRFTARRASLGCAA